MFSELVDFCVARSGRRDRIADISAYANSSIRESAVKQYFSRDMIETQIFATTDPYNWPKPANFRIMQAVQFADGTFIDPVRPGRQMQTMDQYFYSGPTYFIFKGLSYQALDPNSQASISLATPLPINLSYYVYPPQLKYYATGTRPAVFDAPSQTWTYLVNGAYVSTTGTAAGDTAAQLLVANWLLQDWNTLVQEGTLTKLFTVVGDARNSATYALYKSLQISLLQGEEFEEMATNAG